jgi:hypothetical protein
MRWKCSAFSSTRFEGGVSAAAFGREFLIRRADRLLFGTDYLTPDQDIPQFGLFDQFDLPGDV